MYWLNQLLRKIDPGQPQVVNDSKTPSGRVHVGALRGVLIHDAVFRALKESGIPVRYRFGVDDYDPLDELPAGQGDFFEKYLGAPLCNIPALPGSQSPDMAEHYISEFFQIFHELGVGAETYRMRDIYRAGEFNEPIDAILRNAEVVRRVYREVSSSMRSESWYPFQTICEQCGRIGTTEVTDYDGREVTYQCQHGLVAWAQGCGYRGKVSPFDGNGKLPWKLEWVAKWKTFPVTIEGAGTDHNTKGGSRDVAVRCLAEIFHEKPPLNIPYQFFLVGGAKMSSSRGIGASAREMADFLPHEILRFLILRTQPNQPVNFSLDEEFMIKLFNDFDRYHWRAMCDPKVKEEEKLIYLLSEVTPEGEYYDANFQLVLTLVQMPHLDLVQEIEKRKGSPLTEIEMRHLEDRIMAARFWLENYAREEEKTRLQESMPQRAQELTDTQRAFLRQLASALPGATWEDEALQRTIFDSARLTPIEQPPAFAAIYRVLLDRDSGPKAGNLLAFLDREFLVQRFTELPHSRARFWTETGIKVEELKAWWEEQKPHIVSAASSMEFLEVSSKEVQRPRTGMGVVELSVTLDNGKTYLKRVMLSMTREMVLPFEQAAEEFRIQAAHYVEELGQEHGLSIPVLAFGSFREEVAVREDAPAI